MSHTLEDKDYLSFEQLSTASYARKVKVTSIEEGLLAGVTYDYLSMALSAGDTTETYTYKTGGAGGTTVATIVVVYTTSARSILSSVTRTV
jgi:hypothetical protein